ncbi:TonB-dependent receptor domain-containing protein [Muriicola sp. E247]|uniref:TonB-dependent receptor n=1 Tax=Muriicola sp. E247 TaxID=3242730 RepID=UPI003523E77C
MKQLFIAFILLFTASVYAQRTGSIAGKLGDKEMNNEPLAFANVLVKGTTKGTTSDFDGLYEISNLEPGIYTLVFTFLGYETVEVPDVLVEAGKVTEVNTELGAGSVSLNEVVLITTASKDSEVALLLDQKKAVEIREAIGAEALTKKGIDDAAAAVAQIAGISKQQGSSDVYVRGLGDRYQNTTMNGLALPSNNVNKKNIDLDIFSSSIIENISVSKAYTPSFYGDFSAGNVNIDSKEYTGDGYLEVSLGSGINSNALGTDFVTSEGTSFFGFYNRYDNDPFAVVLSHGVDPESDYNPINISGAVEGGYSFNLNEESRLSFFGMASFGNGFEFLEGPALDFTNDIKVRFPLVNEYTYSTTTTAMGNITYRIDNDHKLKFSSLFVNSARDAVGYYGIGGNGFNRDGFSNNGDGGYFQLNVQFNQDMIFVNQLNGNHTFQDDWELDWGIGFNKVFSDEPDRKRISLEDFQFALDDDPNTNPIFYDNIAFDNQRFFQSIEDDEMSSYINLSKKVSEKVSLNFGYNGRRKERRFNNWRYGYLIADKNANPVTDVNNLNDFFDVLNINIPQGSGLWDLFIVRNPQNVDIGRLNRPQIYENTYKGNLDIHAVYATAELNLSDKWLLIPGFRVESYKQGIVYDVINPVPTDPGVRNAYENIYLPSLNLRYALNEDTNLRFSFSKTASFPEFKEAANFVYEGVVQRVGGNPDLLGKPDGTGPIFSEIYNYDLKYEWFPNRGELISVAAFAKTINDPVNRVVATDATGNQRYFRTGDQAKVFGLELEVRKNIINDSNENAILSFGANAAYTFTEQDLKTVSTTEGFTFGTSFADRTSEELEGASPVIVNADINYSPVIGKYKPSASLAFSYFADRIFAIGSGNLGNMVEKSVPTLNFVWQNEIGEHFEANISALNLLNPNISLIRENTGVEDNNPLIQGFVKDGNVILREFKRGVNIGLTLKYKF